MRMRWSTLRTPYRVSQSAESAFVCGPAVFRNYRCEHPKQKRALPTPHFRLMSRPWPFAIKYCGGTRFEFDPSPSANNYTLFSPCHTSPARSPSSLLKHPPHFPPEVEARNEPYLLRVTGSP